MSCYNYYNSDNDKVQLAGSGLYRSIIIMVPPVIKFAILNLQTFDANVLLQWVVYHVVRYRAASLMVPLLTQLAED